MKKLYVIAGPNGAGKTTVSYTVLPEILDCKEFVNADEIAKGLSPFQPEKASIEAGRIMLQRINSLMESGENFAFETTLSSKSFVTFIHKAKDKGYETILLFFYLNSSEIAIKRVKTRVSEGGHNIPEDVIRRRYKNGLVNFFKLYKPIFDRWIFVNNAKKPFFLISEFSGEEVTVYSKAIWKKIIENYA